jgi:serine/threonine protein kinase/tetratricopeptide (TPR) repeat protein
MKYPARNPVAPEFENTADQNLPDIYVGCRLGEYELAERIGEGGMGAVYRACSASGEAVAVKLIKRGMDTDAILRRFHNERRILAALEHPNIARLLDAGTTEDGLPYFVMEYIPGRPVDHYCDEQRLTIDERLRLFLKICAAVECAHQLQVIHRDIKPANILVTQYGEPKLLDFGISKILDRDLLATGDQITLTLGPVMTPRYASPEQARGGPVTPASDIYSLGVLLYELLTGRSPYRPTDRSAAALVHAICFQEAEAASFAIGRPGWTDSSVVAITDHRATNVDTLTGLLVGNLDTILFTALEKNPEARYSSVSQLSGDIERHLQGLPIRARRLRWRQLRRGIRERRNALLAIGAVVITLLALGLGYLPFSRGTAPLRSSVAVLGFENLSHLPSSEWLGTALTEMLSTELAAGGRLRTVPGELVSRVKFELALPNSQTFTNETLARLRRSLSADYVVLGSYLAFGEGDGQQIRLDLRLQNTKSGEIVSSVSETRRASDLVALVTGTGDRLRGQLGAGGVDTAGSISLRSVVPAAGDAARNFAEGLQRLRRFDTLAARDLLRNAVTAAPDHALSHAALAAAASQLGYDLEARDEAKKAMDLSSGLSGEDRASIEGRYFETTHDWDRAVQTYQTLRGKFPDNLEYGLRLAAAQTESGGGRAALETIAALRKLPPAANDPRVDLAQAEAALATSNLPLARASAQRAAQSGTAQGFRILAARAHLLESRIFLQLGDPRRSLAAADESENLYRDAGDRPGLAGALNEAGGVLTQLGDVTAARARFQDALAICQTIGDQACISTDLDSLGVLRRREGDLRGALEMHRKAIEIRRQVGDRSGVAAGLYNIANVLETMGDLPQARQAASEALDLRRQLGENRSASLTLSRLANVQRRQGELDEAVRANEQALSGLRAIGDRGGVALALYNLGLALHDQGHLDRSRSVFEEALAIRREQQDKNNLAQVLAALAAVSLAQDRLPEARKLVTESIQLRQDLGESVSLAQSRLVLSRILIAESQPETAAQTAVHAMATFHKAGSPGLEAEAALVLAQADLALGRLREAQNAFDRANQLLNESRDPHLLLMRDLVLAREYQATGRRAEAARILEGALGQATRLGLAALQFEIRLTQVLAGLAPSAPLVSEANAAGFLGIARKAAMRGRSAPV